MTKGEVWLAKFPFEDDERQFKHRPVVVWEEEELLVLSIKVTSHGPRDQYDVSLQHWAEAGLRRPSVARVSKMRTLPLENFLYHYGHLHPDDIKELEIAYSYFINRKK